MPLEPAQAIGQYYCPNPSLPPSHHRQHRARPAECRGRLMLVPMLVRGWLVLVPVLGSRRLVLVPVLTVGTVGMVDGQ